MSNSTTTKLETSIVHLYSVFARYPLNPEMDGCSHCVSEEEQAILKTKPLRELTADELASFMWSSILTFGDEHDLKHFLPRILELMAVGTDYFPIDAEICLGRLREAGWNNWPVEEQLAVAHFLFTLWCNRLTTHPSEGTYISIYSLLCAVAQITDNLKQYLDFWLDVLPNSAYAKRRLYDFLYFTYDILFYNTSRDLIFWSERLEQLTQVRTWIKDPYVSQALLHEPSSGENVELAQKYSKEISDIQAYTGQHISELIQEAVAKLDLLRHEPIELKHT